MSVENTIVKNIYIGNGATTEFPFTFQIGDDHPEYVIVYITNEDGITAETNNFTVNLETKNVTYPKVGEPLEGGKKITIYRKLPLHQPMNLTNQGPFFAENIEGSFDDVTFMIQQLNENLSRVMSASVDVVNFDTTFPVKAGKSFRINDAGTGLELTEDPAKVLPLAQAVLQQTEQVKESAVNETTNIKNTAIEELTAIKDAAVNETTEIKDEAVAAKNTAVEAATTAAEDAVNNVQTLLDEKVAAAENAKSAAVSSAESALASKNAAAASQSSAAASAETAQASAESASSRLDVIEPIVDELRYYDNITGNTDFNTKMEFAREYLEGTANTNGPVSGPGWLDIDNDFNDTFVRQKFVAQSDGVNYVRFGTIVPDSSPIEVSKWTEWVTYALTSDVSNAAKNVQDNLDAHEGDYNNPHKVTAAQLGLSSAYKFKGSVATYDDLPNTDQKVGDVWNVETAAPDHGIKAGDNVAWDGTAWDNLGGNHDFSELIAEINARLPLAGGTMTGSILFEESNAVQGILNSDGNGLVMTGTPPNVPVIIDASKKPGQIVYIALQSPDGGSFSTVRFSLNNDSFATITGVGAPTNPYDVANKMYVDDAVAGGGGGDVTAAGDNIFTATNTFDGTLKTTCDMQLTGSTTTLQRNTANIQSYTMESADSLKVVFRDTGDMVGYVKTFIISVIRSGGTGVFSIGTNNEIGSKVPVVYYMNGALPDIADGEVLKIAMEVNEPANAIFIYTLGKVAL